MTHNFDQIIERRGTDSSKWSRYDSDVLPLFVADMDFRSPEPVIRALHERAEQGFFGYTAESNELKTLICERVRARYQWEVKPGEITFLPGLVSGLNVVSRAMGELGDGVLMMTPAYPPFLDSVKRQQRTTDIALLRYTKTGSTISYEIDFDAVEAAITPRTRLAMLCNPHNPVGRVYQRWELVRMADICLRHNLVICSDEIHADIVYDGSRHIPMASLSPEIAARCITLMAPSKTFNLPGLGCGYAIAQNPELLKQIKQVAEGTTGHPNPFGVAGAIAAYREGQPWLDELLAYLTANRDYLADFISSNFPNIAMTHVEGTYLAWLDCRESGIPGTPSEFFLKEGRVGLSDGALFGQAGEDFVRLCFASPRPILTEALERMQNALSRLVYH